jgi:signal transduction histidine kinase
MKQSSLTNSKDFMESERIFIELSALALSRMQFLHSVSNQFKLLSDCDALEMRVFDRELQYTWFTDFVNPPEFEEVEFVTDKEYGKIPVLNKEDNFELLCTSLFQKRYDPLLKYEYSLRHLNVVDTSAKITFVQKGLRLEIELPPLKYSSFLLLPFTVQDNPPGLLILYSKKTQFIKQNDVSAYEELMHSLSIALKFRRSLYALNERIKELTCLYEINQIYQDNADAPEAMLQKIVDHLPKAFQYSDFASASIQIGNLEYSSAKVIRSANFLTSKIILEGRQIGVATVFYPDVDSSEEPMHFLPEEKKLLDIISQKITLIYEKLTHKQDKQLMEEQLRHADRLATIGQLGSGIAHELNDPLANILGYAQLLLKTVKDPTQVADLERIVRSSLHAREIVRKLLLFARQMPTQMSEVNLNKVITDTLDLLKSRLEQGKVKQLLELSPDLPMLKADPSQMTQMVTNLCVNAMQAMVNGGNLKIITRMEHDNIIMDVSDNGIGMDEEQITKIFLPFYTTKPVGIGTGLGLSVIHGIITSHNGTIDVQSKLGKGSTFTVKLPLKAKAKQQDK